MSNVVIIGTVLRSAGDFFEKISGMKYISTEIVEAHRPKPVKTFLTANQISLQEISLQESGKNGSEIVAGGKYLCDVAIPVDDLNTLLHEQTSVRTVDLRPYQIVEDKTPAVFPGVDEFIEQALKAKKSWSDPRGRAENETGIMPIERRTF